MATRPPRDEGETGFRVWEGLAYAGHPLHFHHDVEVNYLHSGSIDYLHAGTRVRLEPHRLHFFWAMIPHQLAAAAKGTRMGWMVLPISWLARCGLTGPWLTRLLEGQILVDEQPRPADGPAISQWSAMLARDDPRWGRIVELEVEARIRRMVLTGICTLNGRSEQGPASNPAGSSKSSSGHASRTVEQMTAFLTRRCREPIAVEDVAAHVSLHPHYAMRLFRKHMGMSIIDYLTRQRVAEVQRRLLTSDEPLLSIAHQSGFGSASRFHQAFRRLTGTTPDRFRRQAAGALEA